MRNKFSFYASYLEAIDELPDEQQLQLYKAIAHYALLDEQPTNLTGIAKACFPLIRPNIDSDNRRYDARVSNGTLGGRPKEETSSDEKPSVNLEKPNNNLKKPKENLEKPSHNLKKPNNNLTQTEQKPNLPDTVKPNTNLALDIERDIESKKTDNRILDKESEIIRADLQSLTKKFSELYPLRDVVIPASLKIPQNFDGQLMLEKLSQSTWLRTHDNLGLAWCIKNYDRIVHDAYKDDEPKKTKSVAGAIHTRKYTKEENEKLFKEFENMEI